MTEQRHYTSHIARFRRVLRSFTQAIAREDDAPTEAHASEALDYVEPFIERITLTTAHVLAIALIADAWCQRREAIKDVRQGGGLTVLHLPDGASGSALEDVIRTSASVDIRTVAPNRFGTSSLDEAPRLNILRSGRSFSVRHAVGEAIFEELDRGHGTLVLRSSADDEDANLAEIADHVITTRLHPDLVLPVLLAAVDTDEPRDETFESRVAALKGSVTLADLRLALLGRRTPVSALDRLERRVASRSVAPAAKVSMVTLEDLPGYGEIKTLGLEIAGDLREHAAGTLDWSAIDPGLVLDGPPGVGKTYFARALAASADVPLVVGSFAEWQSKGHLGDMLAAMRATFDEARSHETCVLLLDELDSVGRRDRFAPQNENYSSQVVNSMLELLDGGQTRDGVFIIGCTNRVEAIEPAILRSGRLDRVVRLGLPGRQDLTEMLAYHLRGCDTRFRPHDLMSVALRLQGGSAADAARVVRQAMAQARRNKRAVSIGDLEAAAAHGGVEPQGAARWRVAVHEAGHAIAAASLQLGAIETLHIGPRGGLIELRRGHRTFMTAEGVRQELAYLLAGRAAELIVLGSVSSGAGGDAQSDLAQATSLAVKAVASWGLGNSLLWSENTIATNTQLSMGPEPSAAIREQLDTAHRFACRLVTENRAMVERLARLLDSNGYLDRGQVSQALKARDRGGPNQLPLHSTPTSERIEPRPRQEKCNPDR